MKKKYLVLIVFLISSLVSYSQNLSKKSDDCLVPCSAVRNALILKENFDILAINYMAKSDSLEFQTQVNENLKTVISNKDKELELIRENQKSYENIIKLKEEEIESLNKNIKILKTQKFVSYLISAGTLIFSGYILVIN